MRLAGFDPNARPKAGDVVESRAENGMLYFLRMPKSWKAGTPVEYLRYKDLEHQLDDSNARAEMLMKLGQLLDRTIGN